MGRDQAGTTSSSRESDIVVGARVRLAEAHRRGSRAPESQGTVIEPDKYEDRGTIVRVGFENGTSRWLHVDRLVRFGGDYRADPTTVLAGWEATAEWFRHHHGVVA